MKALFAIVGILAVSGVALSNGNWSGNWTFTETNGNYNGNTNNNGNNHRVPEPSSMIMLGAALSGLVAARRLKKEVK